MNKSSQSLAAAHPAFQTGTPKVFIMSGTSQSAAVVSGAVALMLQANPNLTPDQVKCRLMASAASLTNSSGNAAYSIFQQGIGVVNAYDAVYSQAANCANQGLNIANDIAGTAHYAGPAQQDATTGQFYVVDPAGTKIGSDGYLWNQSTMAPASSPTATESWNLQE